MYRRFSDISESVSLPRDFVVRKHKPSKFVLAAIYTIGFMSLLAMGYHFADPAYLDSFVAIQFVIIAALFIFTMYHVSKSRELVTSTELQNALFAGAAGADSSFYIIVSRSDGNIVYFSPRYRHYFASSSGGVYTLDEFLALSQADKSLLSNFAEAVKEGASASMVFPFTNVAEQPQILQLKTLPISKPYGFSVIMALDGESGNRQSGSQGAGNVAGSGGEEKYFADLFSKLIERLHKPIAVLAPNGDIEFSNSLFWERIGYSDSSARNQNINNIITNVAGSKLLRDNFEDTVFFKTPNSNKLEKYLVSQQVIAGDGGIICFVLAIEDEKAESSNFVPAEIPSVGAGLSDPLQVFKNSPIATFISTANGEILNKNDAFNGMFKEIVSPISAVKDIVSGASLEELSKLIEALGSSASPRSEQISIKLMGDDARTATLYITSHPSQSGGVSATGGLVVVHILDTTEQKNLELRFTHSQKMQAVGQLAGGIAHDFNNLLTAMIGFCDLLLMRHPAGDPSFADIMQIKQNASRAANLVRQLLAFSRRQTLQPKVLDITDVLAELSNLVRRLIGENIELKMNHGRDLGFVKVDQGQFEQVIINLAVNARDAMPNGGQLAIRTSNVDISKGEVLKGFITPTEDDAITPGKYVLVEVLDSGTGIPKEILPKIFEPFFSTKEVGSGTGLGLATVYGIVKQTGGFIYVKSASGTGTEFHLYFKHFDRVSETHDSEADSSDKMIADLTGKGTILLVEDEGPVRIFSSRALRNKGYTIIEADCGEAGLEMFKQHEGEIDLVVTDVIMPGMNGPTMVQNITKQKPDIKVIFMSGYAEDVFMKSFGSEREFNFLPKPFTLKQLAAKVKDVLKPF
jgi:two-component system cell cycle sensor histidine kinase/response regulator CckA